MANIFVIDDDDQLLRMVGLMLERGGHVPTLINSPQKGLEQIREEMPDLLVLDIMMPNTSGHELCREIRADRQIAHLPILVLTARAQAIDRVTALKSGANDYLTKPVNAQELLDRVDDLLIHQKSNGAENAGLILSFMGVRGGIGQTTLAVNLAGALRRITQEEICLVELTPSGGQIAMHLRTQAKDSWAEVPPPDELDWDLLQERLTTHSSGLHFLTSPPTLAAPTEPSGEMTNKILQILGEKMAAVVVDLPGVFNPAFQAALTSSDMVFHVLTPEVISVQLALQTNRALAASGISMKPPIHIMNQVWPEAQLPASAVERGLSTRLAFQVSYDVNQPRALAQGVPLTLTSAQSSLPVSIKRMAEALWQRTRQEQ
ncbi:MAG: response regulator [Candidatus Promineifilaceae bacterium]